MAKAAPGKPISQVKLLSPVAEPPKIMAAPTNYAKHVEEMQQSRDTVPGLARFSPDIEKAGIFLKSNTSLVGPSEGIPMRFPDRRNDHEAELVLIIGKQGSDIPKEKAWDYIAGYSLGLDMTARGQEDRASGSRSTATPCWARGWSRRTNCPSRPMCRSRCMSTMRSGRTAIRAS